MSGTALPETHVTMKAWQKGEKMRIKSTTAGITTDMIVHPDAIYLYDSFQDKYLRMTEEEMAMIYTQKSSEELSRQIQESTEFRILGEEVIDGKLCTIVEYSVMVDENQIDQKLWIWNEKGLVVKTISTIRMGEIVSRIEIEYKNFIFEDIPDSVFEVPEDKIIDYKAHS